MATGKKKSSVKAQKSIKNSPDEIQSKTLKKSKLKSFSQNVQVEKKKREKENQTLLIHRPRIFSPKNCSVIATCCYKPKKITATSLDNGVILIYSYENPSKPHFLGKIQLDLKSENSSIAFLNENRLISCGPAGQVNLFGLNNLNLLHQESIATAVYAVETFKGQEADPTQAAYTPHLFGVACEDTIRLYKFDKNLDQIFLIRSLPNQENRVVSLDFLTTANFLAAGGIGHFKLWKLDLTNENSSLNTIIPFELKNVKISASQNNLSIVWKIKFVNDRTLITSDSSNRIIFWDLASCTSISEFKSLETGAISLAVRPSGDAVFVSGADSRIFQYSLLTQQNTQTTNTCKNEKWVKSSIYTTKSNYAINDLIFLDNSTLLAGRNNGCLDKFNIKNCSINSSNEYNFLRPDYISTKIFTKSKNFEITTCDGYELNYFKLAKISIGEEEDESQANFSFLIKNNESSSVDMKFSYKSNNLINSYDFDGKNLILATKKFLKIYTFNNKKLALKERCKIEIFMGVTAIIILNKKNGEFLTAFTDGSVSLYSKNEKESRSEFQFKKIVKQRSSSDVVNKIIVGPSVEQSDNENNDKSEKLVIFTTFSNKIFKSSYRFSSKSGNLTPLEKLLGNDQPIEFINFSKHFPGKLVIASGYQIFLLDPDLNKIETSEKIPVNSRNSKIVNYDFPQENLPNQKILTTHDMIYLNSSKYLTRRMFSKKWNQLSYIYDAAVVADDKLVSEEGEGSDGTADVRNLVIIEQTVFDMLKSGGEVFEGNRRKFGR